MARSYGSVDAARRKTATRKSTRKPGGGKSPTAKRKKMQRGAAKAAPSYASERYGPGATSRKGTRKPGGSAASAKKRQAAAKKRKTKAMTRGAAQAAPSFIKGKTNTKKPTRTAPKSGKGTGGKGGYPQVKAPSTSKRKPGGGRKKEGTKGGYPQVKAQGTKGGYPQVRGQGSKGGYPRRKPPSKSRNVAHGGVYQGSSPRIGDVAKFKRNIAKAAAAKSRQGPAKGRSSYGRGKSMGNR